MTGILAIDHGTRRTGFAVADALRLHLAPIEVYHGPGDGPGLVDHVGQLLEERSIGLFLVGHPTAPDGSSAGRAKEVEAFCKQLVERFPEVECVLYDERLTTKEAEDRLREAGYHGKERKARVDSWSAWVLLEDWLASGEPRP